MSTSLQPCKRRDKSRAVADTAKRYAPQLDNLMLKGQWPDVSLKMCDFGYSKDESKQSVSKSTCGTPEYMAPEVLFEVDRMKAFAVTEPAVMTSFF